MYYNTILFYLFVHESADHNEYSHNISYIRRTFYQYNSDKFQNISIILMGQMSKSGHSFPHKSIDVSIETIPK